MEDYTLQLSTKFGKYDENMLNVRARTQQEFNALLEYLKENAGTIVLAADTVRGVAVENQPMGAGVAGQPYANHQPAQVSQPAPGGAQPAQAQPRGTPNCAHGPMKWIQGVSKKNNKPYQGYFCPAPQGQPQCEPEFH